MIMWFTVSEVEQVVQTASSSPRRCACVARVRPICSRLIMTASFRLSEPFCLVTPTVGLIA